MTRKYIIPLLALAGAVFAIFTVFRGDSPEPASGHDQESPQSAAAASVAGSGIVEANTENISIGTQIAGIVSEVFVQIGSSVKRGDPLFRIDDRSLLAERTIREAAVQFAEAALADARYELSIAESLIGKNSISFEELQRKRFAAQKADAQLAKARAELQSTETDLERLTVRAPVDGEVLQLKIHPGEFAPVSGTVPGEPLILMGNVTPLHVRVDVDENDAWRVPAGARATGYLRGNRSIRIPLTFVRFEPYVIPKKSLTGDSAERVDTRVLQVIFGFERGDQPVFVGQQMDVSIEAPAITAPDGQ